MLAAMTRSGEEGESNTGLAILKGVIFTIGTVGAVVITLALLKPLFVLGVLGVAGYLGYRMVSNKTKALPESRQRSLGKSDDFERRMRELDALDRRLDAEIDKGS